jgi:ABC-type glycerol-3-phosphate transport system substrate-binding protein
MTVNDGRGYGIDRRNFLRLGAAVGGAMALAGCSGDEKSGGGGGQVTYWTQPNAELKQMQAFLKDIEKGFASGNPGTTAKTLIVPWDESLTKYTAAFSGGNPPDVTYQIIPWMNKWRDTGVLADFHEIAPKEDIDGFLDGVNENLVNVAKGPKGELLAIPYVSAAHSLTVNVDIWEKAGKPPLPTTYDEVLEFAKAMTFDKSGRRLGEPGPRRTTSGTTSGPTAPSTCPRTARTSGSTTSRDEPPWLT